MIFDSHTHLNAEQFNEDIPETIQRAQEMGVTKMAVVGFDTPTIEKSLQLSHDYPNNTVLSAVIRQRLSVIRKKSKINYKNN